MPPRLMPEDNKSSVVNVKVRRITEVKPISTTAPPPSVALAGKHKMLVVLVETADSPWPSSHPPSRYEELIFSRSTTSMREYYRENSYGLFDLSGEVIGPIRLPGRMSDYAYRRVGADGKRVRRLIERAVRAAGKRTKLSSYDVFDTRGKKNKDGVIDHVMVLYAEKSGKHDGFSPIWPHRGSMDASLGKQRLGSYTILNHGARLGVYVHEFGHDIGLPDLYDRDYSSHGAGDWCTMASGSWIGQAKLPAHLSAWAKSRLGWITPQVVSESRTSLRVPSSSERPFALKVPIGAVDSREYFLIENRRKIGFDKKLPAQGLLIWHIDEGAGHNDNERRKMVDVVEASKQQDLDQNNRFARPKYAPDVFRADGNALFNDETEPGARRYDGRPSKIQVRVLSKSARVMKIDIQRPKIFNPGGVPYLLSRDGYNHGRFSTVPLGKGSEALVRLDATPGGFLAFTAEAFVSGPPRTAGQVSLRLYKDARGKPGKVLTAKKIRVNIPREGYTWARTKLSSGRGIALKEHERVWVGVTTDRGRIYPAMNPFSTSKLARYRTKRRSAIKDSFNFRGKGRTPVSDYIVRVGGFGYLRGRERPDPLASEADALVVQMRKIDKRADAGQLAESMTDYEALLKKMEKEPRRYASWIPVVVNSIGVSAYKLKRYDTALERFETSLRRALAAKDLANAADIYENLGETAFFAGQHSKAAEFCERSQAINERLSRKDRLVENLYWLGRAHQVQKKAEEGKSLLEQAMVAAKRAFPKNADLEAQWIAKIQRALDGNPEDQPKKLKRKDDEGKRQNPTYTDLLQFLSEDAKDAE